MLKKGTTAKTVNETVQVVNCSFIRLEKPCNQFFLHAWSINGQNQEDDFSELVSELSFFSECAQDKKLSERLLRNVNNCIHEYCENFSKPC